MKKIGTLVLILSMSLLSCSGDDDSSCTGAMSRVTSALGAFSQNNTHANCLELKAALENQKDVCGTLSQELAEKLASLNCDN